MNVKLLLVSVLALVSIACNNADAIQVSIQSSNWEVEDVSMCQPNPQGHTIENVCHGKLSYNPADFSKEEIAAIHQGIDEVNEFFGKDLLILSQVDSLQGSCQFVSGELPEKVIGRYSKTSNIIIDSKKLASLSAWEKQHVISHESLHSLSMTHSVGGIMCSVGQDHSLNGVDYDQARALGLVN